MPPYNSRINCAKLLLELGENDVSTVLACQVSEALGKSKSHLLSRKRMRFLRVCCVRMMR